MKDEIGMANMTICPYCGGHMRCEGNKFICCRCGRRIIIYG